MYLVNVLLYLTYICESNYCVDERYLYFYSINHGIPTYPDCIIITLTDILLYIQK